MKALLLLTALFIALPLHAADLPTVTIEHLYYLQTRADRVRNFKPDDMIDYCVAMKLGTSAFENLYSHVQTMRIDLTKLLKIEEISEADSRVKFLQKTIYEYNKLLQDEAKRIQNGLVREGQVATDALTVIARAQHQ